VFAPIFTPNGIAAFGRDPDSAKQVWSRTKAIPATRATAIFTATSVSIWTLITSALICRRPKSAVHRIKYHRITPAQAQRKFTIASPQGGRPTNTPAISSARASSKSNASPESWIARRWSCLLTTPSVRALVV